MPKASAKSVLIEKLLRKMAESSEFPALSDSITTLNKLNPGSDETSEKLADAIVKDFALTNKVLRVVNSAYYSRFAGKVSTISRAIVILGIEPIRSIATSLIFFDRLTDQAKAKRLRECIANAMFSSLISRQAARQMNFQNQEEAFLGTMFHGLGEILVAYYLPDEDKEILAAMKKDDMTEQKAQRQVLGVTYEELGIAIAEQWNFPDNITQSMKKLSDGPISKARTPAEQLSQLAGFSTDTTRLLVNGGDQSDLNAHLARYKGAISIDDEAFDEMIQDSRVEFSQLADKLSNKKAHDSFITNLIKASRDIRKDSSTDANGALAETELELTDPPAVLLQGLQEITALMTEKGNISQVATVALETLYRAFGLEQSTLCLRDNAKKTFVAKLSIGSRAQDYHQSFKMAFTYSPDVFHAALEKRLDVYINDTRKTSGKQAIPDWFTELTGCRSFLILPLTVADKPIGFLLAEHHKKNGIDLSGQSLELARSLRNQLGLAFQLSSSA